MTAMRKRKCITFSYEGKRYYCYGKTLLEAGEKAVEKKESLMTEGVDPKAKIALDEYFEEWNESRKGSIRASTERTIGEEYKNISAHFVNGTGQNLGKLSLDRIDKRMVLELQKELSCRMMTSTVNCTIALLRRLLNEAVNDRLLDWNPCNGIKPLKRTEESARDCGHRALSVKETMLFFEKAKSSRYYNLYRFLINSGLRCGEAGALKITDINKDTISITRTVINTAQGLKIGDDVKTRAGKREIPYTDSLKRIVKDQIEINKNTFNCPKSGVNPAEHLFYSPRRGIISVSSVDSDIKRICIKAGIEPFTAHAFRDTFATRAIESGMNPKTLQEILGHSSYGITMTLYAHVMPSTKAKEMQKVKTGV